MGCFSFQVLYHCLACKSGFWFRQALLAQRNLLLWTEYNTFCFWRKSSSSSLFLQHLPDSSSFIGLNIFHRIFLSKTINFFFNFSWYLLYIWLLGCNSVIYNRIIWSFDGGSNSVLCSRVHKNIYCSTEFLLILNLCKLHIFCQYRS